ncbi:hypothetical protein GCM10007063_05560 [Lentibacillus kapialis]|uniref:DUF3168 domain-containing protein n=1 Tax=Lentibacillus kapialis TaxID=340214 RepID=A0A917PPG3_9BACI|nr:hypothetical protein [Lentibacillus kapialis]GGJ85968.1 hypothetical protein GCM10007063_05560 [Lentibacillus kapialis]
MQAPDIQLYNAIFSASLALGYDTYDYLPNAETAYPFVHVAETTEDDVVDNKQVITGTLAQTIHVWGYANNRAEHSSMVYALKMALRKLSKLENYYLKYSTLNANTIYDNSTDDDLLHSIITAEYRIY